MKSEGLDQWRNFFKSANVGIFEIIDHAILVAAKDHPEEFNLHRGQIVEKVYSCQWGQCCCHNHNELARNANIEECANRGDKESLHGNAFDDLRVIGGRKDSETDIFQYDPQETDINQPSKYSYSEAEALTAEIDEENEIICEVYRIKEVIQNENESQGVLLDSLRRLQSMELPFQIVENTEIGKSVNALSKHKSIQIRQLARSLVQAWRIKVENWLYFREIIAGSEPQSMDSNPSVIDEEGGLPQPPLDMGAILTPQVPMEISLSQFFDGIDEDGNPQNSMEIEMNSAGRIYQPKNLTKERNMLVMDDEQVVKQESVYKPIDARPSYIETVPQNSEKQREPIVSQLQGCQNATLMKKVQPSKTQQEIKETKKNGNAENARKQPEYNAKLTRSVNTTLSNFESYKNSSFVRAPIDTQGRQFKSLEKNTIQEKLEAATRKLKQDYQQLEYAKRQRTIQLIDVKDLPKLGVGHKSLNVKQKKQRWWQANHRN